MRFRPSSPCGRLSRLPWMLSLVAVIVAVPLDAQVSELTVGARLRVRAPDAVAGRLTGVVVARTADSLTLTRSNAAPVAIPLVSLTEVEVSRGRSRSRGALKGAAWGAGVSAVFGGLLIGEETCEEPTAPANCTPMTRVESVAYGAVSGALLGAIIGVFVGSEHWERVRLPDRVAVRPLPTRGVPLQVTVRW